MHKPYCSGVEQLPQIPNAKQILSSNKAMNDQIGLLRVRWACPMPDGKCGSKHCFVQANPDDHFLLEFHELESWAAAIICSYFSALVLSLTFHYLESSKVPSMQQLTHLQITPFLTSSILVLLLPNLRSFNVTFNSMQRRRQCKKFITTSIYLQKLSDSCN